MEPINTDPSRWGIRYLEALGLICRMRCLKYNHFFLQATKHYASDRVFGLRGGKGRLCDFWNSGVLHQSVCETCERACSEFRGSRPCGIPIRYSVPRSAFVYLVDESHAVLSRRVNLKRGLRRHNWYVLAVVVILSRGIRFVFERHKSVGATFSLIYEHHMMVTGASISPRSAIYS